MKFEIFALPECSICKNLKKMIDGAVAAGKLEGDVGYTIIDPNSNSREQNELLMVLDRFEIVPPALAVFTDAGDLVFAQGSITSLRIISVASLRRMIDAST